MKRALFGIVLLVFIINSISFAKTYDLSQISQVKLVSEYSGETTVDEMDTVIFGSYPQSDVSGNTKEPIEWIVLDRKGNKAFLLSKYILDSKSFEDTKKHTTWENCSLRNWINNTFVNESFNDNEKQCIVTVNVKNPVSEGWEENFVNIPLNDTYDKCFLLNSFEIDLYFKDGHVSSNDGGQQGVTNGRTYGTSFAIAHGVGTGDIAAFSDTPDICENVEWLLRSLQGTDEHPEYVNKAGWVARPWKSINDKNQGVRPALWVSLGNVNATSESNTIIGLPSRESELRSDNHFYLDNNMQKNSWVYYKTYYYHVDGSGNIQKNQWIELRYVGADGRMYRGRQTPDGKWVGDDGLVVDVGNDLSKSLTIEAAEPDSWYKTQSGLWYYFENDRTTTKKGWFTDKRDNQTYYLDPQTGIMAVGWTTINGNQYYFNESHNNELNWYETGGGFYESYNKKVKAYGSMFKNETTPDGKKVDANGRLIK